jgi:hypothetical protein
MYSFCNYSTLIILPDLMCKIRDNLAIITGIILTTLVAPSNLQTQLIAHEEPDELRPDM